MFESRTYENLVKECLEAAPPDIDTREGSIFYDSVAAKCLKLAEVYADLETVQERARIDTATGTDLDSIGKDQKLYRNEAVPFRSRAIFEGEIPEIGTRFFCGDTYLVLKNNLNDIYPDVDWGDDFRYLEAEIAGETSGKITTGDRLIPYQTIEGLTSAVVGEIITIGENTESDDSYRERLQTKVSGPAENGNKYHYKVWCEQCDGVALAKVFPTTKIADNELVKDTPNWVTGILIQDDGTPALESTVEFVQNYIDPGMEGLGEGVANLGAHFMAAAALSRNIDISITGVELSDGYELTDAQSEVASMIKNYFKELVFSSQDIITIRIKQIAAIIASANTILDYVSLKVNNQETNIVLQPHYVAVLQNIKITEV